MFVNVTVAGAGFKSMFIRARDVVCCEPCKGVGSVVHWVIPGGVQRIQVNEEAEEVALRVVSALAMEEVPRPRPIGARGPAGT